MAKAGQTRLFLFVSMNTGYRGDCRSSDVRFTILRLDGHEGGTRTGYLRIIDESGEDYLYPAQRFVAAELARFGPAAPHPASRLTIGSSDRGRSFWSAKEGVDELDKVPSFDAGEAPASLNLIVLGFTTGSNVDPKIRGL